MRAREVRGAGGGEAGDGGVVSGHGAGDGGLQDQAERHPGALQGGHQAHVRVVSVTSPDSLLLLSLTRVHICVLRLNIVVYYCNTKFSLVRVRTDDCHVYV